MINLFFVNKSTLKHTSILAFAALLACQPASNRPATEGLTEEYARYRAERITNVSYDLSFHLEGSGKTFRGSSEIAFDWQGGSDPLTIDFSGGEVQSVQVNGADFPGFVYNKLFVALPAGTLRDGRNTLRITFTHPYSRNSDGLYRFHDPVDDRVYLFTDFEPYRANHLFPCFDQPDLKADYAVTADVPARWQVISGVRESNIEASGPDRRRWQFERGQRYSTYIFALHAGDYEYRETAYGDIPLRLYYRQSLAPYVDHVEWFRITRQGLAFFQEYFDNPYPYQKYDQLLVPDFNIGAMENVGAVTFNERYAPRGKPTYAQRERRANVILHEMAHMWFGNLVTMRWWDDLWLNESFATYMAYLALDRATEYRTAWRSFFARTKQWAYREDGQITTHPIVASVPDTAQAFVNFDGITYGKGAASLKQLAFYLGPDAFRDGVRAYIKKFAGQNTVMKDFMDSLSAEAGVDLNEWSKTWLYTSGTNTLAVHFTCEMSGTASSLKEIRIEQSAPERHPTLREHHSQLALFARDADGTIRLQRVISAPTPARATSKVPLPPEPTPCPVAIFPNHEDHDFSRTRLDPVSLKLFREEWRNIRDPFSRSMIWQSLYKMVRAGELPVQDLLRLTLEGLTAEDDVIITGQIAYRAAGLLYYMKGLGAEEQAMRARGETVFRDRLTRAAPASPLQKIWFNAYINITRSPEHLTYLASLLKAERKLPGLTLDQDRRWKILRRLIVTDFPGADALLETEEARDLSERGAKAALASRVSRKNPDIKRKWFDSVLQAQPDLSLARQRIVLGSLFPREQEELQRPFAREFFEKLPGLIETKDELFLRSFVHLAPTFCEEESQRMLADFNEAHADLPPIVKKGLLIAEEEDGRCVRIRARAAAASASK